MIHGAKLKAEADDLHRQKIYDHLEKSNAYFMDRINHLMSRLDKLDKSHVGTLHHSSVAPPPVALPNPYSHQGLSASSVSRRSGSDGGVEGSSSGRDEVSERERARDRDMEFIKLEIQTLVKKVEMSDEQVVALATQHTADRKEIGDLKRRLQECEDRGRRETKDMSVVIERCRRRIDILEEELRSVKGQVIKCYKAVGGRS